MKQIIYISLLFIGFPLFSQTEQDDYLLLIKNSKSNPSGYIHKNGDTIISPGKYPICFTDTFRNFAIVLDSEIGFIAINREDKILFEVFPYDNGPDYLSEGLFRIISEGKIGFANIMGEIVIPPRFDCAYPFENGRAKVSFNCHKIKKGEHTVWESLEWVYIDKSGHVLKY